jgi:hypothetical protein
VLGAAELILSWTRWSVRMSGMRTTGLSEKDFTPAKTRSAFSEISSLIHPHTGPWHDEVQYKRSLRVHTPIPLEEYSVWWLSHINRLQLFIYYRQRSSSSARSSLLGLIKKPSSFPSHRSAFRPTLPLIYPILTTNRPIHQLYYIIPHVC